MTRQEQKAAYEKVLLDIDQNLSELFAAAPVAETHRWFWKEFLGAFVRIPLWFCLSFGVLWGAFGLEPTSSVRVAAGISALFGVVTTISIVVASLLLSWYSERTKENYLQLRREVKERIANLQEE